MKRLPQFIMILFLLAAMGWQVSPAAAQEGGTLVLSTPETGFFPTIRFRLDAFDAQGNFLDSLKPADIQIIEDGQTLKPETLQKVQNSLQVIVVLNTSPSMANQVDGVTGYQRIQTTLIDWAKSLPAPTSVSSPAGASSSAEPVNDYSFATPTGLFVIRQSDPQALIKGLTDYQPDLAHAQPTLGSLAEALDLATDPMDHPAMKRTILYITPPLPDSASATLSDLTSRAKGVGVPVNVWEASDKQPAENTKNNPNAVNPLQQLAEKTGGQYQAIPKDGPLPEIEPLFRSLRQTYQVSYPSSIQKSGGHSLSVRLSSAQQTLSSNESSFNLTVQPPNPIFLSPPDSIERTWAKAETKNAAPALTPSQVPLQIVVEFPDQHTRPLKATRLYENGKLVAENTTAPFDRFDWPVSSLTTPSRVTLRVEAVDVLNLSGSSMDTPVDVTVEQPAKTSLVEHISGRGMIAVGAMIAAGAVLTIVLVFTGSKRRARRNRPLNDKWRMKDPVTQPVQISQDHTRPRNGKPAISTRSTPAARAASAWPGIAWPRPGSPAAPARLVMLDENEQPITGGVIPLTRQEITFGTDARRATQVLDSPTVAELHARLYRSQEGQFFLADQDTIAGTWVNYAPLNSSGERLEHGDLIHIGKVMFRFELTDTSRLPPAEIQVMDLEKLS